MKKILSVLIISLTLITSLFAQINYESIGVHVSAPFTWQNVKINNSEVNTNMNSFAVGIDGLAMYTDLVGLYANCDIIFPQKITLTTKNGIYEREYNRVNTDYKSIWGMSVFVGAALEVYRNKMMLLTISPGVHGILMYTKYNKYSFTSFDYGIGVNFQDTILIGKLLSINLGADLVWDCLGETNTDDTKYNKEKGTSSTLLITPRVGIGIRF